MAPHQAGLAEGLKMCLHRGIHGQEGALEESAEGGGSHFSDLIHKSQGVESFRLKVRSAHSNIRWVRCGHTPVSGLFKTLDHSKLPGLLKESNGSST
uniref:Uncharacterized protein n=1 Tax=Takifugu rubripes TaxID=31033 RepID=A0A674N997_TAKRU